MSKWHKSTGSFQTPPLKDPYHPNQPLATTLPEKRAVLARNLLQNPLEVEDIPLNTPAVPSTALPFPTILITDVERAILQTGNTAPRADKISTGVL